MKKLKMIIPIIAIIIIILIIVLYLISIKEKNENIDIYQDTVGTRVYELKLRVEDNKSRYCTMENIIKSYFLHLNEEAVNQDILTNKEYAYYLLDENYVKNNNVTQENVWQYVRPFGKNKAVSIQEMYVKETSEYIVEYIHVILRDKEQLNYDNRYDFDYNYTKQDAYYRINVDSLDATYSVQPITLEEYNKKSIEEDINIDIKKTPYNRIKYTNPSEYVMCVKYLEDYNEKMRYDIQQAYNVLNEEYRKKRFGTFEKYKEYVLENKDWLDMISLDKYQTNYYDDYVQYVCVDTNGNNYIFKETSVMQYTVELDTYTLETDKFKKEYNIADEKKKTMMNIDKFINMINNKDYKNAYLLLDESFRNNNFISEEAFENYIKQNFFEYNTETYVKYEKVGQIHSYSIQIKDLTGKEEKTVAKTIFMKILEGTDFVMSFNIQ